MDRLKIRPMGIDEKTASTNADLFAAFTVPPTR